MNKAVVLIGKRPTGATSTVNKIVSLDKIFSFIIFLEHFCVKVIKAGVILNFWRSDFLVCM